MLLSKIRDFVREMKREMCLGIWRYGQQDRWISGFESWENGYKMGSGGGVVMYGIVFKALAWSSLYRTKAETKLVQLEERLARKERILVKKI